MTVKSNEKKREFSERLTSILNHGALNLAMALGYKARLFDVMDEIESPTTATAIAAKAGLNGRYVEEWLGSWFQGTSWNCLEVHREKTYIFFQKSMEISSRDEPATRTWACTHRRFLF